RLTEFAQQARISFELVKLKDNVDVEVPVNRLGLQEPDSGRLLGFLRHMEFATLTKRIAEGLGAEVPPPADRGAAENLAGASEAKAHSSLATAGSASNKAPPHEASPGAAVIALGGRLKALKIDRSKYET